MRVRTACTACVLLLAAVPFGACGSPVAPIAAPTAPDPEPQAHAAVTVSASSTSAEASPAVATAAASSAAAAPEAPARCPADMKLVDGTYCPKVERQCLRTEENKPNHLTLCHKFAHETKCVGAEEKRTFCIDEYEYPNRKGEHPPWMVSWFDAQATCESKGKRLCGEGEWVMACEGPEHTPFPYGWDRDQTACNIDNVWIDPRKNKESGQLAMYSKDAKKQEAELERLDQSVPSGALERCVSGYGVRDMTGNFDEWVTREGKPSEKDKSKWAGLKGGAWGHVRNACRPMTTSHEPEFTYYFVSFRCCADARDTPPWAPAPGVKPPRVEPADRAPLPKPAHPTGPSARKVQPEN